ncbi:unnamed protein product [marine sediment metagenome]|uniref:Uncharacterized protein n=1 Tax=marine sediment metagenome TaxID=412755 RepID=X1BTW3_9ZZZZ
MSIIFICVTALHLIFADIRFRYDAYLVGLGIIMVLNFIKDYIPTKFSINEIKKSIRKITEKFSVDFSFQNVSMILVFFIIIYTSIFRTSYSFGKIIQGTTNIYEQQFQMALFLQKYYKGECIGVK